MEAFRTRGGRGFARRLAATLGIGVLLAMALPQAAVAPAASAHSREPGPALIAPTLPALEDFAAALPLEDWSTLIARADADWRGMAEDARERARTEVLRFGHMRVQRGVVETILRAAAATGVDPVYMMALADKESSFSPEVRASTSSAEGLFQFITRTWLEVVRDFGARHGLGAEAAAVVTVNGQLTILDEAQRERVLGLRRDPYLAAVMAAEFLKRSRARIEQRLGRDLSRSEFYLAHFLGADSAGRFITFRDQKPKQSAPRAFRAAAQANRALFFVRKGRRLRDLTVAEVYDRIDRMIDDRLDRYQGVAALVATGPL